MSEFSFYLRLKWYIVFCTHLIAPSMKIHHKILGLWITVADFTLVTVWVPGHLFWDIAILLKKFNWNQKNLCKDMFTLFFCRSSSSSFSSSAGAVSKGWRSTTGDRQGRVMGGGRVIVQFRGIRGLFSMHAMGLAGSKLLWCTEWTARSAIGYVRRLHAWNQISTALPMDCRLSDATRNSGHWWQLTFRIHQWRHLGDVLGQ